MNGRMSKQLRALALQNVQRITRSNPDADLRGLNLKSEARRLRRAYTRGSAELRESLRRDSWNLL
jgi:hypothetical protein